MISCLRRGQFGYDHWELYEQAVIQREMECDSEDEESEESGVDSTDALSRYIYRYIDVRTFTATAHARHYAQT